MDSDGWILKKVFDSLVSIVFYVLEEPQDNGKIRDTQNAYCCF